MAHGDIAAGFIFAMAFMMSAFSLYVASTKTEGEAFLWGVCGVIIAGGGIGLARCFIT